MLVRVCSCVFCDGILFMFLCVGGGGEGWIYYEAIAMSTEMISLHCSRHFLPDTLNPAEMSGSISYGPI